MDAATEIVHHQVDPIDTVWISIGTMGNRRTHWYNDVGCDLWSRREDIYGT